MDVQLEEGWKRQLSLEFEKEYFVNLTTFVRQEYKSSIIYPQGKHIFKAFNACPFEEVKVVILGQDPYHGSGQAHGLCFSVPDGVALPPSLRNIYKELSHDLQLKPPISGNLEHWANQGVLLLNTTLTVRAQLAGSHQGKGWELFTDSAIRSVAEKNAQVVFMLWGSYAQKKRGLIDPARHLILQAPHPSPLSAHRGFLGCRHFSKANDYLLLKGKSRIEWLK